MEGQTSLKVLEAVVEGLMVILNNHNSRAGWCCSEQDGEGLWWTAKYPQEMWLQALAAMAENYATNPRVVGLGWRAWSTPGL